MKLILMNQQQMTVQIWGIGTQLPTHLLIKCMERNTNKLGFIRTPCVFPLPLGTSFTVRHAWKIIFHTVPVAHLYWIQAHYVYSSAEGSERVTLRQTEVEETMVKLFCLPCCVLDVVYWIWHQRHFKCCDDALFIEWAFSFKIYYSHKHALSRIQCI